MDFTAALPTFVVTLREGFEAALVVGIVLACLEKAGQTKLNRWVYVGISAGVVASVIVGLLLWQTLKGLESNQGIYAPVIKESLEGIFGLIAIAMLSWMLIWMTQQAKSMKSEVEGAIQQALINNNNAVKAIFILIFIAVLREGFETVLFIVAKFQDDIIYPTIGAVSGLTLAAVIGVLLFKWGIKINIRLFFQVMGVLLLLIVGGLVIGFLKHVDASVAIFSNVNEQLSWCIPGSDSCILGPLLWDASNVLPDKQFPGIILKTLFGYRQILYLAQGIAYLAFLALVGGLYFRSLTDRNVVKKKEVSPEAS